MSAIEFLRIKIKAARNRRAIWVRMLDVLRLLVRSEGRARLWTTVIHADEVHQTTPDTRDERYPELFDLAARLSPDAALILSFGCSTGEELLSLRRRFPQAEIVGVEINPRSRRIARRRTASDRHSSVHERTPDRLFDIAFALAVLQREPHKIAETNVADLSPYYPFHKFDAGVVGLVGRLRSRGLLCVQHSHYRIEDSSAAGGLEPIECSPALRGLLFGRTGLRIDGVTGRTLFRKRAC